MKILITVDIFNQTSFSYLKDILLKESYNNKNHIFLYGNLTPGEKITQENLKESIIQFNPDIIIAGVETYSKDILNLAPNLKCISRVGIGVDAIDHNECSRRGIVIENTPDAPSNAVAELTIGQIFNALRFLRKADSDIRAGKWVRYIGKDLSKCTVGIIGHGRIGSLVYKKLKPLCKDIYVNDIDKSQLSEVDQYSRMSFDFIIDNCDIISLHIPLNSFNKDFITKTTLEKMKSDVILINTSRGGIINEEDLLSWLITNPTSQAVVDTFINEPYYGQLKKLENCYLTSHMGSCTINARQLMEIGAIDNIRKYL